MSGHSKWSTIKRQKAVTDSRRASLFTKLGRLISVATRAGGNDPTMNFRLRLAIDKARAANMPNDNVERAIKAGTGEGRSDLTKEVVYEGFGPGHVAVIIQAVTDNTNRTAGEIRAVFQKFGGQLGPQNSISWMFGLMAVARVPQTSVSQLDRDRFQLAIIDAGADDIQSDDDRLVIKAKSDQLGSLRTALDAQGVAGYELDLEYVPQTTVVIDEISRRQLFSFFDGLEDLSDVTNFFSNDA